MHCFLADTPPDHRAAWTRTLFAVLLFVSGCNPPTFADGGLDSGRSDIRDIAIDRGGDGAADVPLLGRVCQRSSDCDDQISCTQDFCGANNRCVNLPDNNQCDDGVYCNGGEVCDVRRGCRRGDPVACSDDYVCTQDRCDEALRSCVRAPLDRDGDGDPDWHCYARECNEPGVPRPDAGVPTPCWVGGDCDDLNDRVGSRMPEVCGDTIDNNCNEMVDEMPCERAQYDQCNAARDVSAGGLFDFQVGAAQKDYTLSCAPNLSRDVVARFHLDAPRDVWLEASSDTGGVAIALQTVCGSENAADTVDCQYGFTSVLRKRSMPAGDYFVIVGAAGIADVVLSVQFRPPTPPQTNDQCTQAEVIPSSMGVVTLQGDLAGLSDHVITRCGGTATDAVYSFTLSAPADVTLQLAGAPRDYLYLSLATTCDRNPTMVTCDAGSNVQFTSHQLAPGTYYVFVESFVPVLYTLQATFAPATPAVTGDRCNDPIVLTPGMTTSVPNSGLQDDYAVSCTRFARDVVFAFDLTTRSDVAVSATGPTGQYAVAIRNECAIAFSERTCNYGRAPIAIALGLDPGRYYAIVKVPSGTPNVDVRLDVSAPVTMTTLNGGDTCASAVSIPEARGLYAGDTRMMRNDFNAPCLTLTDGPDAVYALTLTSRKRVTLVTNSSFQHAIWIAQQNNCPGAPPTGAGPFCTFGVRTSLDVVLDPGAYRIFIDGQTPTASGTYTLLTNVAPAM